MKPTLMGRMRRKIFTPNAREVTVARRGFDVSDPERQANLENVGLTFLTGYAAGLEGRAMPDIESSLERVERPMRGFAYEGCGMAMAVRDALPLARRHWVDDFIAGPGAPHIFMAYVGVGWAMARLPVMRWRAIMPRDQLLRWLALDGYGFHQAYFRTSQYVGGQYQTTLPLWRPSAYANRAMDQGIGRALWFVNGSDPERVAATIGDFPPARRGDLWSGAGLASVYAGGVDAADLKTMASLAGDHLPHAAQGAAFAAKARLLADLATPHTDVGAQVYCGMSAEEAAAVTDSARDGLPDSDDGEPVFEVWRQRIRKHFE
jgi:enediyne biosynthesis protein E3